MKTIINLFFLIVLLHIFLAGCSTSSSNEDRIDGGTEESEESEGDTDYSSNTFRGNSSNNSKHRLHTKLHFFIADFKKPYFLIIVL